MSTVQGKEELINSNATVSKWQGVQEPGPQRSLPRTLEKHMLPFSTQYQAVSEPVLVPKVVTEDFRRASNLCKPVQNLQRKHDWQPNDYMLMFNSVECLSPLFYSLHFLKTKNCFFFSKRVKF